MLRLPLKYYPESLKLFRMCQNPAGGCRFLDDPKKYHPEL
jgi:hypothetical protein